MRNGFCGAVHEGFSAMFLRSDSGIRNGSCGAARDEALEGIFWPEPCGRAYAPCTAIQERSIAATEKRMIEPACKTLKYRLPYPAETKGACPGAAATKPGTRPGFIET